MSSSPDPVAALRDAWRSVRQSLSFTSVRGRGETSTHHLHIAGYSNVSTVYKHGKGVESKPFRAGGHRWKLTYYPNGYPDSKTGCPGVLLSLMENRFFGRAADATAGYSVSVLDRDGNLLGSRCAIPQHYSLHDSSWGPSGIWMDVPETEAAAEETKAALRSLKNDSLVVRCELTVQRSEKESRPRWLLRRFLD